MAKNFRMKQKTANGYDILYPETNAKLTIFNNANTTFTSSTVEDAIKEIPMIKQGTSDKNLVGGRKGDVYIRFI